MQRFRNILYVVSHESDENAGLRRAIELAQNNQAQLTIIDVVDEVPATLELLDIDTTVEQLQQEIIQANQQKLDKLVSEVSGKPAITTRVFAGITYLEVIREVLRNGHDLVIKPAESGGFFDRVFGSDDMHLLRKCPCPVWLIRAKKQKQYKRILAAIDVDDVYPDDEIKPRNLLNMQILEIATSLALSEFAELHIVSAWEAVAESLMRSGLMPRPEKEIEAYLDMVRQQHKKRLKAMTDEVISKFGPQTTDYIKPELHLIKGSPRREIAAFAKNIQADMVVMGTVGRTGISGFFMGNTAESILSHLECGVLAIKPVGFKTPVTLSGK